MLSGWTSFTFAEEVVDFSKELGLLPLSLNRPMLPKDFAKSELELSGISSKEKEERKSLTLNSGAKLGSILMFNKI